MRRGRKTPAATLPLVRSAAALPTALLRVAWLAVLLGLVMDAVFLAIAAAFDSEGKPLAADTARSTAWSGLVCIGIAVGLAASRARPQALGLAGLVAAPMAFYTARSLHKGALQALAVTATAAAPSPILPGFLKGVEYACLGAVLGLLSRRAWAGAPAYAGAGFGTGVVFGGIAVILPVSAAGGILPAADLASRSVNQVLFPVGCSLVIFAAQTLGRRMATS